MNGVRNKWVVGSLMGTQQNLSGTLSSQYSNFREIRLVFVIVRQKAHQ